MNITKASMEQNFFTYLPSEIMTEIFLRLPAQAILSCKCTCKSWRVLVETREFIKLHFSRSIPGLALTVKSDLMDKIVDHTDDLHVNTITTINFSYPALIQGSVDGLILLLKFRCGSSELELHLCNPTTREYIDLHSHSQQFDPTKLGCVIYGFGMSKISGQYKVVGIFHDQTKRRLGILPECECKIYTIGTGSWKNIAPHALVRYNIFDRGAFVNGSLHWLGHDLNDTLWISCLDLETELFSTFSLPPPLLHNEKTNTHVLLFSLEGKLCLCDYTSNDYKLIIWLMKEYGDGKSWSKEIFIESIPDLKCVYPAKILEDGVILTTHGSNSLFYYSIKNKTTQRICTSSGSVYITSHSYTPSLLSLKCFRLENSVSF